MPQSGILYALVARGQIILAEYSGVAGNSGVIALQILEKLSTALNGDRLSYIIDNHAFHVLISNGITFVCMTEQSFGRRIPFAYLEDVAAAFAATHGPIASTAAAYQLNAAFSPVLRDRAAHHSNPLNDTITRVNQEVGSLRDVMVNNIESVLERGERLELLVQRTDGLAENAFVFKRGAVTLKNQMWWRNKRTVAMVVGLVLLLLYIVAALICSPTLHC